MTSAQLLLRYQALVDRERTLRESIAATEARLQSDPTVVEREDTLASARARQDEVAGRLRESDKVREDHRSRLRTREKELMSGRIRNPTELMQMSTEVAHMKARFAEEEEAELQIMEDAEAADEAVRSATRELDDARRTSTEEEPGLRSQLSEWNTELDEVVTEKEGIWAQVPQRDQALFSRIRVRPPIAKVSGTQCSACHVTVTSSGMQILRKGDALVQCENCGRILVQS
ncbi:MAG TPA: C4-type zinc ribbon domain-containing protein [Candidatus Dormibacteraeota bacterium]|nr:C4-type zinc ribbon domain-containing protein [Candidatus Dormibacteraeota bacterium]